MSTRSGNVALAQGEIVHARYCVLETLEEPSVWRATYLVEDTESPMGTLIAQQFNVPSTRGAFEERLNALNEAVSALRDNPHPSRPRIADFFSEEGKVWLLLEPAGGTDVATLIATRSVVTRDEWRMQVAVNLAAAIKSLIDLGQKQAIAALDAHTVAIDTAACVTITNFGFGLFLRPGQVNYHRPHELGEVGGQAVQAFGRLMYGVLSGEEWKDDRQAPASTLSSPLGRIVLRALVGTRDDAYRSFDDLWRDVTALTSAAAVGVTSSMSAVGTAVDTPPTVASDATPTTRVAIPPTIAAAASSDVTPTRRVSIPQSPEATPTKRVATLPPSGPQPPPPGVLFLHDRYRVIEVLDSHPLWGDVYVVQDLDHPKVFLVAKQIKIPPLRKGLEERMARVRETVEFFQQHPDPTRVQFVDMFTEDGKLYLISERAPGVDLKTLIAKKRKFLEHPTLVVSAAIQLAEGLRSLVRAKQYQAFANFGPSHVVVTREGQLTLINYGINLFLRPGTVWSEGSDADEKAERLAIKFFGQLVYSMALNLPCDDRTIIVEAEIPEVIAPIIMRSILSGREQAYKRLDDIIRDLNLLSNLLEDEKVVEKWITPQTRELAIPWRELGVRGFLKRSSRMWFRAIRKVYRSFSTRKKIAVILTIVLALWLGSRFMYRRVIAPASMWIPNNVVYVACENGEIEVWGARNYDNFVTVPAGNMVRGMLYSNKLKRVYLCIAGGGLQTLYPRKDESERLSEVTPTRSRPLLIDLNGVLALLLTEGELDQVNLRTLTVSDSVEMAGAPTSVAYDRNTSLAIATMSNPPRLKVFSPISRRFLRDVPLDAPPVSAAFVPDAPELWVLPAHSDRIEVLDETTFEKQYELPSGGAGPMDVVFDADSAYVLNQETGSLARIDRYSREVREKLVLAGTPVAMTKVGDEIWVASSGANIVTVVDSKKMTAKQTLYLGGDPRSVLFVP